MNSETRSPLKDKPLRNPGQSLEEERNKLIDDKIQEPAFLVAFLAGLTVYEWWRYYTDAKPSPVMFTVGLLLSLAFFAWRVWRVRPRARALRQGIEGEKAVGQFLERLREKGYQVFHDLVTADFNVDHIIIGPAGVFTVETKTWSKPTRGEARIHFDGEKLLFGGREPDRDPVIQARAQTGWLRELLKESTGRAFDVRPVVVFPGWYIEQAQSSRKDIWVLNPKALPAFLDNEPERLSIEDVKLASYHLARFIRSAEAQRN